jgi:16S rRNA (cytidine1402-2'-O)-methyltransferase
MRPEQSQQRAEGILYLVAVPIGHPDDITVRAIRILREADLIASENPVATRGLLAHHGIEATLTSYGPSNVEEKAAVLIERLRRGARIAFVSDCGSPVIADPGSVLVTSAHAHGIPVASIPGASALTTALAAAGMPTDTVIFLGPLPDTAPAIRRRLAGFLTTGIPAVAFCAPDALASTLSAVAELARRRTIVLACDLTTPDERILRGTASHVRRLLEGTRPVHAVTLIVAGRYGRGRTIRRRKP